MNLICLLRTIWYSKHLIINPWGFPIVGHDFVEQPSDKPVGYGPIKCRVCGKEIW